MTTETGKAKGLKQVLEEHGFNITGMHTKCSPVCHFKNNNYCMAHLLSKQDNFCLQKSLLEQKIQAKGHHSLHANQTLLVKKSCINF